MKFGFRIPSLTKRIAARTSVKRIIRHNQGLKAPIGMGPTITLLRQMTKCPQKRFVICFQKLH
jgi:hypothetical protein